MHALYNPLHVLHMQTRRLLARRKFHRQRDPSRSIEANQARQADHDPTWTLSVESSITMFPHTNSLDGYVCWNKLYYFNPFFLSYGDAWTSWKEDLVVSPFMDDLVLDTASSDRSVWSLEVVRLQEGAWTALCEVPRGTGGRRSTCAAYDDDRAWIQGKEEGK